MAAKTTAQSGYWDDGATWGGTPPGQTESCRIDTGHVVTIRTPVINERNISGTDPLGDVQVEVGAVLEIARGGSLTVKRDLLGCPHQLRVAGSLRVRAGGLLHWFDGPDELDRTFIVQDASTGPIVLEPGGLVRMGPAAQLQSGAAGEGVLRL